MLSEVYNQSICVMNAAVYMHYVEKKNLHEIAEILNVSKSTISRLLKRAIDEDVIQFEIASDFLECTQMEKTIKEKYHLQDVLVLPVYSTNLKNNPLKIKKKVALEGARYLQRIITDDDIIGLTWGGTMYHLIQYLNPCRKANAKVITLHGSIANCDEKLAVDNLVKRAAMAFGGKNYSICDNGLFTDLDDFERIKSCEGWSTLMNLFENINISISGVGAIYPIRTTPLATASYLNASELEELMGQDPCADIMLRFIDKNGQECETTMKKRTFSIELEMYKKIPRKIIVASGSEKEKSVRALLKGGLLDVLVIDQLLAMRLLKVNQ